MPDFYVFFQRVCILQSDYRTAAYNDKIFPYND